MGVRMTKIVCDLLGPSAYHSEALMSDSCHCHYSEVQKTWVLYCQAGERIKNAKGKVLSFIHIGQVGFHTLSSPLLGPSFTGLSHTQLSQGDKFTLGPNTMKELSGQWEDRTHNLGFVRIRAQRAGGPRVGKPS